MLKSPQTSRCLNRLNHFGLGLGKFALKSGWEKIVFIGSLGECTGSNVQIKCSCVSGLNLVDPNCEN